MVIAFTLTPHTLHKGGNGRPSSRARREPRRRFRSAMRCYVASYDVYRCSAHTPYCFSVNAADSPSAVVLPSLASTGKSCVRVLVLAPLDSALASSSVSSSSSKSSLLGLVALLRKAGMVVMAVVPWWLALVLCAPLSVARSSFLPVNEHSTSAQKTVSLSMTIEEQISDWTSIGDHSE